MIAADMDIGSFCCSIPLPPSSAQSTSLLFRGSTPCPYHVVLHVLLIIRRSLLHGLKGGHVTHAGQSVVHPSGYSDWLQNGHLTQAEPIGVPSLEFTYMRKRKWKGWRFGWSCVRIPTLLTSSQRENRFSGEKKGGGQHIRRQQNQALSWGRGGGREIQVPEVCESPRLWDLGVL